MTGTSGGAVVAVDRYQIDPDRPLPEFDCGTSKAFAVMDLRDPAEKVFAVVPDAEMPLRLAAISRLKRVNNNNLLRTLAWDTVDWPADGRRRPAIILEKPHGPRLFAAPDMRLDPIREEALVRRLLQPLCAVLEDLSYATVVHRNIRAENLYLDGIDVDKSPIMLGECVSAPAGYLQPVVYETIECGMVEPAGRGEGSAANDFYALGVTAAFLLMGRNPLAGIPDDKIIEQKLAQGTYAALLSTARIPSGMIELFRGLLNDDPIERWGLEETMMWIGGRRASPKQQVRPSKASRPIEIGGRPYVTARSVAEALSRNWDEGLNLVQSGTLDDWLRRGLADEDRTEAVNNAKAFGSGEETVNDVMLARICFALDPGGPVRLRNFRATIDGIGTLLACGYANEQVRIDFTIIVREHLLDFCIQTNSRLRADIYRLAAAYERLSHLITRDDIGYGLERALYTLNGSTPCRSPLFDRDYVAELFQLLPALDRLAKAKGGTLESLIDRHIAAFVALRVKAPIAPELRDLRDAKDHFGFVLPTARILAFVQEQAKGETVPTLCRSIASMLEPALERYHNRETRDEIRRKIQQIAEAGVLAKVVAVVDDPAALLIDDHNFRAATAQYAATVAQLERIAYERENRASISHTISSQVASLLSGVTATVAVLVTILVKLL